MIPRLVLALALTIVPKAFPAACCLGSGSKSFLSLQRLQKYELGASMSYKEDYGRFESGGELVSGEVRRSFQMVMAGGIRLHPDWQFHALIPLVSQTKSYGPRLETQNGIGDLSLWANWTPIEALFSSDWYPTIQVLTGIKIPTGSTDRKVDTRWTPGTGNGIWEPYVGVGFEKRFGEIFIGLRTGLTGRYGNGIIPGHQVELSESLSFSLNPRFSLAMGSNQVFRFESRQGNQTIPQSSGRSLSVFLQPTYFLERSWSIALSSDFVLPFPGWSSNSTATQSVSILSRLGFF